LLCAKTRICCLIELNESDIRGSLSKALSAHVDMVLADDTTVGSAHTASSCSLWAERSLGMRVNKSLATHFVELDLQELLVMIGEKNAERRLELDISIWLCGEQS